MNPIELHVISKAAQDSLAAIIASGALNVENGDITIHMQGNIVQSIEIKVKAYQRKRTVLDFTRGSATMVGINQV